MDLSFTSFSELIDHTFYLKNVLKNYDQYLAHTHSEKPPEKLYEHTQKVLDYFLILVREHDLNPVADSLISDITNAASSVSSKIDFGDYLKRLFIDTITFHDFGKINENFQVEKMGSNNFNANPENGIESKHSKLSAYLFINFHAKTVFKSDVFNNQEKALLYAFTYLFANPILKHHSSFIDHYIDFDEDEVRKLRVYLDKLDIDFEEKIQSHFFNSSKTIFNDFEKVFESENYFSIYALLKLNFSLLTSSDFYATFAFRNDREVEEFGLLNEKLKKTFADNFQNLKTYNQDLFKNFDKHLALSFEKVQERSTKSLNQLRKKLAAEVINNIRENSHHHLFYLEAPTGSGKTNLSLAGALELLNIHSEINKIFYVFPFTTLVSQTFKSVKETIGVTNENLIQLHSKSGFHTQKNEIDSGEEREEQQNYIDNLFLNYPITLLTHIKFFDILKGNSKESNYLLHRLSNSVVIIDELQTYDPKHWDKVIFFLSNYAKHFNIRFILMSATLPKIDELDEKVKGNIVSLVDDKNKYFQNSNFSKRVTFDFSLLNKEFSKNKDEYLVQLREFINEKSEEYASENLGKVRVLVECIIKKTANKLYRDIIDDPQFTSYKKYLISGEILEPRRAEIIEAIEKEEDEKVIVISTQVVEAGVDIDMDLGFKDRSLIDSDEQLAGRINRNAGKNNCKVYLFDCDRTDFVYRNDKRYKITRNEITNQLYKQILTEKDFDVLYKKVTRSINERNTDPLIEGLSDYQLNFKKLAFRKISDQFKLIEDSSNSVYIPLDIPKKHFSNDDLNFLLNFDIKLDRKIINGGEVFEIYRNIISDIKTDFINKKISLKKIYGLMSKFMFSVFKTQEDVFEPYINQDITEKYGILYLQYYDQIYSYENGLNTDNVEGGIFI